MSETSRPACEPERYATWTAPSGAVVEVAYGSRGTWEVTDEGVRYGADRRVQPRRQS